MTGASMAANICIDLRNLPKVINKAYMPYFATRSRFFAVMGGAGSGKSVFASQKIALRMMVEPHHHILGVRKVLRTCRTSIFGQMRAAIAQMGVSTLWEVNKSDLSLRFKLNGNVFRCVGLDDPEKIKSVVSEEGLPVSSVWIEEATEIAKGDLEQLNLRLRGKSASYKQILMTFNPISALHFLKAAFFDCTPMNATTLVTTYKDNRFLDPEYIEELEGLKEKDETLYRVYALGQWGILKGVIYRPWNTADYPISPDDEFYGLDFGFNNPAALARIGERDGEYFIHEEFFSRGLTEEDLIERIRFAIPPEKRGLPIYCDSSEPDKIQTLKNKGFNAMPSNKSVSTGITFVKGLRIFLTPESENIREENQTYKWAEDKDGNLLDTPVKAFDHSMDAIRYALFTHVGLRRPFRVSVL